MASHLLLEDVDLASAPSDSFIIEVGSVREISSVPSTLYLHNKATQYGLNFRTIDFSETSWKLAREYVGEEAVLEEGKTFLEKFTGTISVLYLDNFDYPYNTAHAENLDARCGSVYAQKGEKITRERSAEIHFRQFIAACSKLSTPCWVIIDNTFRSRWALRTTRPWWGKGGRAVPYAIRKNFTIVKEGLGGVMLFRDGKLAPVMLKLLNMYCGTGRGRYLYQTLGYDPPQSVDCLSTGRNP